MRMPEPDAGVIARRAEIAAALREIVPGEGVISEEDARRPYESDGLTAYRTLPLLVVLPSTTEQVARVLRYCRDHKIKVVPRGAGTSLSGGALPLADGIILGMAKFNRVLEVDFHNRCVVAQPGVTNLGVTLAVQHAGFYYAPDPSSQIACTIGGNVAENSGGVHCLKYGLTTNNVLGVELVTIDGEIIRLGGKHLDSEGYDLLGVLVGSEGLLGVVTEVTVRILPKPTMARAVLIGFPSNETAGNCVAAVIAAGIIPGGSRSTSWRSVSGRSPRRAARSVAASPTRRTSGCCSGQAARRRFPPSAASRRITSAWTAPSRVPRYPRR